MCSNSKCRVELECCSRQLSVGNIQKDEFLLTRETLLLLFIYSRSLGGDLLSLNSPKELDVSDLFRLFPSALGEKNFNKGRTQNKTFLAVAGILTRAFF